MGKVQQAAGTTQKQGGLKRLEIASADGTVDMKTLLPDAWKTLTTDNFAFAVCKAEAYAANVILKAFDVTVSTTLSYNAGTGILTISGKTSTKVSYDGTMTLLNERSVVCYYC